MHRIIIGILAGSLSPESLLAGYHQPSDSYQSHNQLHHLLTNL
jgi:hypothetical protein